VATREQVSIYFPCHSIDEIRDRMCQAVAESNQKLARVPRPFGAGRAAGSPFRQLIRFPDRQSTHFPSWTCWPGRVKRRRDRNWRPRNVADVRRERCDLAASNGRPKSEQRGTPCRPQSDAMMLMFKDWLTSIDRCGRLGSSIRGFICPCVHVNEGQRAGSAGLEANKKKAKAAR
jgi:hypothetical protein